MPKNWSFDQWPLRRKLAAALVFPMLLAVVFGGLRVKSEFDQAGTFSAAAQRTKVLRPLLEFNALTQALAASTVPGGPARNPATVAFDDAASQLEASLKSGGLSADAKHETASVLANGRALRNAVGQSTAFSIVIGKSADTARTTSAAVSDLGLTGDDSTAKTLSALQDAIAAQQAMTSQQLNLANKDDAGASIFAIGQVGAETSFLTRLKDDSGEASRADVQRLSYDNYRRSVTLQAGELDDAGRQFLNDGYRSSNQAYSGVVQTELNQLESTLSARATAHRNQALVNSALVLLALLAALGLVIALASSLLGPIRAVREGALEVANKRLPEAVARMRDGQEVTDFEPIPVTTHEEMGQLARAVDDLHKQALTLAGDQHRLRVQVGHMFETLSRRSTSLIDQQLTLIEKLESDEEDPKRLQSLFRLDHLAARMRRNSDSLLVLAGTSTRRGVTGAISVSDAVRAAVSEVENYERIDIGEISRDQVLGAVGSDLIHLVAEVVDNALAYSPPTTRVDIRGARTPEGGLLIEVTDHGLGMPPKELAALNDRLAHGGDVTADTARRMGLFVVGNLAKRHGIAVRLRRNGRDQNGITVSMHLPAGLLADGTAVRTDRAAVAARAKAAQAGEAAPLSPAAPTSAVGGTTKAGLPTRVRGASGATPTPVPGAAKKLPTRSPGASGPGAPAEPSKPAKPVVETAHGESPAAEGQPVANGRHPNGAPADTNGHPAQAVMAEDAASETEAGVADGKTAAKPEALATDAKPEAVATEAKPEAVATDAKTDAVATDAKPEAVATETKADAVATDAEATADTVEDATGKDAVAAPDEPTVTDAKAEPEVPAAAAKAEAPAPEVSRSPSGLPVRQRNASRITEYREFEASPEATSASEPAGAAVAKGDDVQVARPSRLTSWLPGRKAAAEAAAKAAQEAEPRQMPSNLSAWLDHRAKLVEAAKTRESGEEAEGAPAPTTDAVVPDEAAPVEAPSDETVPALVEAAAEETAPVEPPAEETAPALVEAAAEEPTPAPVEAAAEEPVDPAAVESALETEPEQPATEVVVQSAADAPTAPAALPTRVPGTSGSAAAQAPQEGALRPTRRPLATGYFGARRSVDATQPAPAAAADEPARVAEPVATDVQPVAPVQARSTGEDTMPEPLPPAPPSASNDINSTPIFRAMMSNWLTDDTSASSGSWSTNEADSAWSAAARVESQEPMEESSAGLPKRRPGSYLIPGAIERPDEAPAAPAASRRDPETIRRNLNRHHEGVSSARTEAEDGTHREEADVHH